MSVEIVVVPNALEPLKNEVHEAPALVPWLMARFGKWPATARLYHRAGGAEYDVTPEVADDVPSLSQLHGTFVVRIFPAGLDPISGVGGLVFGAIKLLDWILPDVPNIKTPAQRAQAQSAGSANNALGKRSNEARPEQRIPYIVGGVRAVPDLLAVPYSVYIDHVEHEIAYYCVGVGDHAVSDIRDGDSLISQVERASAEVYGPGKAPTGGLAFHEPHTTVGDPIEDDVYNVFQVEAVNGQELRGFSDFTFYGSAFPQNLETAVQNRFFDNGDGTGVISVPYSSAASEITDRVQVGDELFIFWPTDHIPAGGVGTAPDLSTPVTSTTPVACTPLTVLSIDDTDPDIQLVHITVGIPLAQQAQWALLETYFEPLQDPGGLFPYVGASFPYAQVTPLTDLYAGPFFADFEHAGTGATSFEIVCNFLAPRGLFSDDGVTTRALYVEVQVILTPADASGNPNGTPQAFQGTLEGSATARGSRALTLRCIPTGFTSTRCLVQARRLTNTPRKQRQLDEVEEDYYGADLDADPPIIAAFSGTVVDEIRWTHCYSMSKPPNISFGDVTTIHTRTVATTGALRVKERQLNCFAYRKIQTWNGSTFGGAVVANDRAENILFTVMKDSTIGNLDNAFIDFTGIAAAFEAVRASVWSDADLATSFNFTFDDTDTSFEETMQAICQSAFCVAYREGNVLKVRPELAGDDSVLLLNHRNILSGTQKLTQGYGAPTENDSVEVAYVDPLDDTNNKVTVPRFGARLRPKQVKVVGLRDAQQAYWHAYRAYHKMRYQRQSMTLEATAEAQIVGSRERILVADETRRDTQAGDVIGFDGSSTIRTSQPVELEGGRAYSVSLQSTDGTVATFPVVSAPSARELELDGSPDVNTDPDLGLVTKYLLVPDDEPAPRAYLVSSTIPTSPMTHQVEAVNYSHMYYLADGLTAWVDFANGLSDLSPRRRTLVNSGGVISSGVWTGEFGDSFEDAAPTGDLVTASYTKILWINATATPTNSGLIQSTDDTELFAITVGDLLVAGHDGSFPVGVDYSEFTGAEHMVAVTYDETTERLAMLIDGALVDEDTVDPPAVLGIPLRYLEDYEGTCRMLLKWGRALTDREVMEIYLRTRT